MRKLYRSITRARMQSAGLRNINRPILVMHNGGPVNMGSYFAYNWRTWCLTESPMTGRRA